MRTWIFDDEGLRKAVDRWVKRQVETGHPKAVANAAFVGEAIIDMLNGDPKLYRDTQVSTEIQKSPIPTTPVEHSITETKEQTNKQTSHAANLSIEGMLDEWYTESE